MNNKSKYILSLNILSECRNRMINDVVNVNPDLYKALHSSGVNEVYEIQLQIYELKWIVYHIEKFDEVLVNKSIPQAVKNDLIKQYLNFLKPLFNDYHCVIIKDEKFLKEKIKILEEVKIFNNYASKHLDDLKVLFMKEEKILEKQINIILKDLEENENG